MCGDPALIQQLSRVQTPWAVSAPALAAMRAVCSSHARSEVAAWQAELAADRVALTSGLRELGLHVVPSSAPFLLVRGPGGLREKMRARGFGLRRGDTFPGLNSDWFRVRVPGTGLRARLLDALGKELQ